ncbi:hypothetical protein Pla163_25060 [Planctomycetes bacterium Pla163]|uniref:Uncharacterized protein n=1 Tax=Rohdeia mirabilis TaxID=2528008 RepID=A0A518D1N1_9BACT|nr:hypothetical protein Pla163_25060 [Planctomycetes bacterium Pla163]
MQESKGDHENPSDETPRFELRLSGEDDAPERAPQKSASDANVPVGGGSEDHDIYASTGASDRGETYVGEEEEEIEQAFEIPDEPVEPEVAPVLAFEVPDVEASHEPEMDEVLVFQIDDEDDLGPQLPQGMDDEGDVAVYGELGEPGDVEEFSELGETWEARLNGEEPIEEVAFAPDRRRAVALAAGAGALVAFLMFSLGGDEVGPETNGGEEIARTEAGTSNGRSARKAPNGGTDAKDSNARTTDGAPATREPREPREPRSMVAGIQNLFGTYSSTASEPLGPEGVEGTESFTAALFGGDGETQRREGYLPVGDQVVLPAPLPNLQMADASTYGHLWLEPGLPPGGVQNASYLQTPLFGGARVHTRSDEFFDGRLVGLGGGRVVIETGAGEITLHAEQVGPIERLMDAGASSFETLVAHTTGERVRVRAPGGWLSGEVVRQDSETVTLLLESGGRITVDRSDVTPAASAMRPRLAEPPRAG